MDDSLLTATPRDPSPDAGTEPESLAALTARNRRIVTEFARLFYTERDVESAFRGYVAEDYIQHNPGTGDGREAALTFLAPLFGAPGARFDLQRIVVDGDLAAIHVHAYPVGRPELAVADFYRLADGLIVEHWDAIQPVPDTSANDHPMF